MILLLSMKVITMQSQIAYVSKGNAFRTLILYALTFVVLFICTFLS
jgi:hypothetical protein